MKFILVFLLFFTALLADRDGGPYLGLGYGGSEYYDGGLNKEIKQKTSQTLTFYAGAYINKHLSVEFNYVSFDAKDKGTGFLVVDKTTNADVPLSFSVMSISALAHYAFFDDALDFYARFGAGEMNMTSSSGEAGATMVYGAGIGYRFNKYLSIKVAYDTYQFGYDKDKDKSSDHRMKLDHVFSAIEVQF